MGCESELKDWLGEYVRAQLPEEKAAIIRKHLTECTECASDAAQIETLLPGMAVLTEEHIQAEVLVEYACFGSSKPKIGDIEDHLVICEKCQSEYEKLRVLQKTDGVPFKKPLRVKLADLLPSRKIWYAVAAAAALVLIFTLPNFRIHSQGPMIAVLPFKYIGLQEKKFFVQGLNDEIIKALEKVPPIGIIALSSALQYKNTTKKPSEIGRELGIDYLVSGTIQWNISGKDTVLNIASKMVRIKDGLEVWNHSYEPVWAQIYTFPCGLAQDVISALQVEQLEPICEAQGTRPTDNIQAYEYYLRGNFYFNLPRDAEPLRAAIRMYQKAIELDSNFALAYCMLSRAKTEFYWHILKDEPALWSQAREAVEKALTLQPNLPEAHLALGSYYYHGLEFDSALVEFELIKKSLPNCSELWEEIGYTSRRRGKWNEAITAFKKAFELDPRDANIYFELGQTYRWMRKYFEAESFIDRAIALAPSDAGPYNSEKALLYLLGKGNIKIARKILEPYPKEKGSFPSHQILALSEASLTGNYQPLLSLDIVGAKHAAESLSIYLMTADIYRFMNQQSLMYAYYDSARMLIEREGMARINETDVVGAAEFHSTLGRVYAGLGRKKEAIQEGKKAVDLMSRDTFFGPDFIKYLADIYVMVGEYDAAIDQIEYLLSIPGKIGAGGLRFDPNWIPLRSHPRFQGLINERA